ncbi:hypothetical protein KIN20_035112 [Parelaphostrongylus tenuis]|uniref:Uncharacterized protein n=1 Tax=Parelaphostrongylus tenuis TaxID=148309 RepID=A0AAD5WK79_PARTN|nr:hypothetical protein KIN20_035112 [Parelaphostrongylus tenuis]
MSQEQNRLLILHKYRSGSSAAETFRRISEAWMTEQLGELQFLIVPIFSNLEMGYDDEQKGHRSQGINGQADLNTVETSLSFTTRMLDGSKNIEFYRHAIMNLPEKWERVTEFDEEYFD